MLLLAPLTKVGPFEKLILRVFLGAAISVASSYPSSSFDTPFDDNWLFHRGDGPPRDCPSAFPEDLGDYQCFGLNMNMAATADACRDACCVDDGCETWQFCPAGARCATSTPGCWIGAMSGACVSSTDGWISRGHTLPARACTSPFCEVDYDDSAWRLLDVPHDWSIEDLPPRDVDENAPVLGPRYGTWSFARGDDAGWSAPDFDDSSWQRVAGRTNCGIITWIIARMGAQTMTRRRAGRVSSPSWMLWLPLCPPRAR